MATAFSSGAQTDASPDARSAGFAAWTVNESDSLVVHVAGELGLAGRHLVTHSCLQDGQLIVRVDMTELTYIDADGFGGLVAARHLLERCGGSLAFFHASGQPRQFLANDAIRPAGP